MDPIGYRVAPDAAGDDAGSDARVDTARQGDGAPGDASTPIKGLSVGAYGVCVIDDGRIVCWGANDFAQLGRGCDGALSCATPAPVELPDQANIASFRAVTAGYSHTCGITDDASLHCWGDDSNAQLGYGVLRPPSSTRVVLTVPVVEVTLGLAHTCARDADGSVWCWGLGSSGQLGVELDAGAKTGVPQKTPIVGAVQIRSGYDHTCALLASGEVACWGDGSQGQTGVACDGGCSSAAPNIVSGLDGGATRIATTGESSCALIADGTVRCWGLGSTLGDGVLATRPMAAPVLNLAGLPITGVAELVASSESLFVRGPSGSASGWGTNSYGLLESDASALAWAAPIDGFDRARFVEVSLGGFELCGLRPDGTIACRGVNNRSQIGPLCDSGATCELTDVPLP